MKSKPCCNAVTKCLEKESESSLWRLFLPTKKRKQQWSLRDAHYRNAPPAQFSGNAAYRDDLAMRYPKAYNQYPD